MNGKPCIRGLRVTVGTVVGLLAAPERRRALSQRARELVRAHYDWQVIGDQVRAAAVRAVG